MRNYELDFPERQAIVTPVEKPPLPMESYGPGAYGTAYDPESLMAGSEDRHGLTPNDHRHWPSLEAYKEAVAGRMTPEEVLQVAPRVKNNLTPTYQDDDSKKSIYAAMRREQPTEEELFEKLVRDGGIAIVSLDDLSSGAVHL